MRSGARKLRVFTPDLSILVQKFWQHLLDEKASSGSERDDLYSMQFGLILRLMDMSNFLQNDAVLARYLFRNYAGAKFRIVFAYVSWKVVGVIVSRCNVCFSHWNRGGGSISPKTLDGS